MEEIYVQEEKNISFISYNAYFFTGDKLYN